MILLYILPKSVELPLIYWYIHPHRF